MSGEAGGVPLDPAWIARIVATALDEDLGPEPGRDVTTQATIPAEERGVAHLVARADGVVAGLVVVPEVLAQVGRRLGLPRAGRWEELVHSDAVEYGGAGEGNLGTVRAVTGASHGLPATAELVLPALSTVWLAPAD